MVALVEHGAALAHAIGDAASEPPRGEEADVDGREGDVGQGRRAGGAAAQPDEVALGLVAGTRDGRAA